MRIFICIILLIIFYYQLSTFSNVSQLTQLGFFFILFLLIVRLYQLIKNYRNVKVDQQIRPYEPVMITIEQHIIRIPLEDRIDLAIEDNHNVHNKTIKRTAIMAINELKKSDQKIYSVQSAIDEIKKFILSKPNNVSEKILTDAHQSLSLINDMNTLYYTANIEEKEIIRLIWERINHPINKDQSQQLKENFIKELADCKNGSSSVHCCEGRVIRVLQSLQNCDKENIVDLRPMWAFKEEIENKISKYREKLLKKAPSKYAEIEQKINLNDEDRRLMDQFNHCLLKNLSKRFDIDYLKPRYLNKHELADLTKTYYDSLYDY